MELSGHGFSDWFLPKIAADSCTESCEVFCGFSKTTLGEKVSKIEQNLIMFVNFIYLVAKHNSECKKTIQNLT